MWNDRVNAPSSDMDASRLGPVISEAYALASLDNHYFSWLYQFKIEHPNNTLITEHNQHDHQQGGDDPDHQQEREEIDLFCGALVLSDCEISVPVTTTTVNTGSKDNEQQDKEGRNNDFKILLLSNADPTAHKAAKDHAQEISKGIKAKIDSDRQGNSDGHYTRHDSYKKMSSTLDQDMPLINQENVANAKKRKRKSKSGMAAYTSSTCKSKKGSDENAGWLAEGKKLVCEVFQEIKQDERSGIRKKWENAYKHMSKVTKQDKAKAVDDDDKIKAPFEIDVNMLYMEV